MDINVHTFTQGWIDRLGNRHQYATFDPHDDLLRLYRLVELFLLCVISANSTSERACNHRDIAPGAATDQATDTESAEAPENRADATVMIGLHLRYRNLLNLP
ncbi:hypothetical protein EMIT0P100_180054 [Pseudomonas sp. IT-P100]